jgi:hypothetical protein
MELKRGWWKRGEWAILLVGEHNGKWYGLSSTGEAYTWSTAFLAEELIDGSHTYCGDGPKPVEPVWLGIGWWEKKNGNATKIVKDHNDGRFRWADLNGNRYDNEGMLSLLSPSKEHSTTLVKRRPDLDAKEAAEQAAKPDPRDAEIDRLKDSLEHARSMLKVREEDINNWRNAMNKETRIHKNLRDALKAILDKPQN